MATDTTSSQTVNITPSITETKGFWWALFYTPDEPGNRTETVVNFHPFTAAKMLNFQLLDWRSISEYEYTLWQGLNTEKK